MMDQPTLLRTDFADDFPGTPDGGARATVLLESQLRARTEDAEVARQARDAILRNVSHELRTPLNHILGGVEVMLRANPDDKQAQWLATIRGSAGDLLGMVNRLLDLARLQSDGLSMERVTFNPRDVLADVQATAAGLARRKGVELRADVAPGVPETVVGSPTRLAQALLEYTDNALKHTTYGRVDLRASLLGGDARGHHLRFAVSDTGPGIDPHVQSRLFQPFSPGDSSIRRKAGGMGNGLAVVRAIARAMGGDAGVESAPASGSTFWLTARFAPAALPALAAPTLARSESTEVAPEPAARRYPTPNFVTLGDFEVDRVALRGSFRVALDDVQLPERFRFSPNDAGWCEWVGPVAASNGNGAHAHPLYALDPDTAAAVSRALHSAVPRLLPTGRDPLSGVLRDAGTPAAERAFDPQRYPRDLTRLIAPGFTVTVSTLP